MLSIIQSVNLFLPPTLHPMTLSHLANSQGIRFGLYATGVAPGGVEHPFRWNGHCGDRRQFNRYLDRAGPQANAHRH